MDKCKCGQPWRISAGRVRFCRACFWLWLWNARRGKENTVTITPKLKHYSEWCYAYAACYPGLTCAKIEGATSDCTHVEVFAALHTLVAFPQVAYTDGRYTAIEPVAKDDQSL
jgi:hypothetical protein